jgi:hypothetical protein
LAPAVQPNQFSTLAQTLSRNHYALEYKTSITSTDWTAVSTNSGNGALEQLTDPATPTAQRFYRTRQW